MRGLLNYRGFQRIYIIGAGFSVSLGMPLAKDILKEIYNISLTKSWFIEGRPSPYGQAHWLLETLNFYFPLDNFTHKSIAQGKHKNFDIEKFLSYACAGSAFGEKWDEHGDKFISFLKGWIAESIFNRQREGLNGVIPNQYCNRSGCIGF